MNEIITKKCGKCGKERGVEQFYNNKYTKDGKTSWCKECDAKHHSKWQKEHYQKNKGTYTEKHKKWIANNKERRSVWKKEYYRKNREELKEYASKWRTENTEKTRTYAENRRARMLFGGGKVSQSEWENTIKKYGGRCLKCGSPENIEMDHVVPLSKGGKHLIENIQPLCARCNSEKRCSTVDYRPKEK